MTQNTADSQYLIPEKNFPAFEKAIAALSKKCLKFTGEEISLVVFGYELVEFKPQQFVKCYNVLLNTPQLVSGDWKFVGVLDHSLDPNIGNLVRSLTSDQVPVEFRHGYRCNHCSVNRFRKQTFLLRETTSGEYKQVGSSCLKDFTKIDSVHATAKAAELLSEVRSLAHASSRISASDNSGLDLLTYMAHVASIVRKDGGFISVSAAKQNYKLSHETVVSTAEQARNMMAYERNYDLTPDDYSIANHVIEWGKELVNDPRSQWSDYFYNLSLIARNPVITWPSTNMAASLYNACLPSRVKTSEFLGEVGETVTLTFTATHVERKGDGSGVSYILHRGHDEHGNYVTFTRQSIFVNQGQHVKMTGTIKQLDVWGRDKSTRLVRIARV
jgi:hypothetical protein